MLQDSEVSIDDVVHTLKSILCPTWVDEQCITWVPCAPNEQDRKDAD